MKDEEYQKTNREKVLSPRKGLTWCSYCDSQIVADGAKCKVCGKRNGRKRFKK